jgi:hypothetical protein
MTLPGRHNPSHKRQKAVRFVLASMEKAVPDAVKRKFSPSRGEICRLYRSPLDGEATGFPPGVTGFLEI